MNNKLKFQIKDTNKSTQDLNTFEQNQVIGGTSFEGLSTFNKGGSLHDSSKILNEIGRSDIVIDAAYHHLDGDKVIYQFDVIDSGNTTRLRAEN